MAKSLISATIDTDVCVLAYKKIENVSGFIENALRIELDLKEKSKTKSKDEIIEELKIQNAHLVKELEDTAKKLKEKENANSYFDGFIKA